MNFKYVLVAILGAFLTYILLLPRQVVLRKSFVVISVLAMMLFAANPDLSTSIANYFGITRGADFLFYLSHLILLFIVFIYYLKFKDMEVRFARLVRHVALIEAGRKEFSPRETSHF